MNYFDVSAGEETKATASEYFIMVINLSMRFRRFAEMKKEHLLDLYKSGRICI